MSIKRITMKTTTVRFAPWVGSQYSEGLDGLRILLVGESHYAENNHERPTVTPEIVKALALGERHPLATKRLRQHPHFTKIMRAVTSSRRPATRAEKADFWGRLAYYNFIQEFIPAKRSMPIKAAWLRGKAPFCDVLDVLRPDLIVCLSERNGDLVCSLAGDVPVAVVHHPSSHFKYSTVIPKIAQKKAIAMAAMTHGASFSRCEVFDRWSQTTAAALPTPGSNVSKDDAAVLAIQRRRAMAEIDDALVSG
jgi:hypothetical protein